MALNDTGFTIDGQLVLGAELAILYERSLTGGVDVARLLNSQDILTIESQLDNLIFSPKAFANGHGWLNCGSSIWIAWVHSYMLSVYVIGTVWGCGDRLWDLVARPWVPISSPLTHVVYLLPILSYLAGYDDNCSRSYHCVSCKIRLKYTKTQINENEKNRW